MITNVRARTTTQRGAVREKKARFIVMILLMLVAVAIILVEKKESANGHDEIVQVNISEIPKQQMAQENLTSRVPVENIVNHIASNENALKQSPEVKEEVKKEEVKPLGIISPVEEPKVAHNKSFESSISDTKNSGKSKKNLEVKKNDQVAKSGEHVVKSGDTLSTISKHYYGTSRFHNALFQANEGVLHSAKSLKIGQKIKIPAKEELEKMLGESSRRLCSKSQPNKGSFIATSSGKAKLSLKNAPKSKASKGMHIVQENERLIDIAKQYGLRLPEIYELNKDVLKDNPNRLRIGTELRVIGKKSSVPMASHNH